MRVGARPRHVLVAVRVAEAAFQEALGGVGAAPLGLILEGEEVAAILRGAERLAPGVITSNLSEKIMRHKLLDCEAQGVRNTVIEGRLGNIRG